MYNLFKSRFFLIYFNLLCFFIATFLYVENVDAYTTFTYTEKEEVNVTYNEYFTFGGDTIGLRVTRQKNDTCLEPEITLRLLGSIGNVTKVTLNYEIPEFNFCVQNYHSSTLSLHQLDNKHLIATYLDTDDFTTFIRKGIVFTLDGEVVGDSITLTPEMSSQINSYNDLTGHFLGRNGFLFITSYNEKNFIAWTQLSQFDQYGNFQILRNGTLNEENTQANVFPTVDGSFALAYVANHTYSTDNISVAMFVDPQWTVQVSFLRLEANIFTPSFLLYQTELRLTSISINTCFSFYDTLGYGCLLQFSSDTSGTPTMVIQISFLSSGAITDITNMHQFLNDSSPVTTIYPLFYGGYLVMLSKPNQTSPYIEGVIYDVNRARNSTLNFPNNVPITYVSGIFGNYSFWSLSNSTTKNWTIVTTELPRFLPEQGYLNTKVVTTYPAINDTVQSGTKTINITFTDTIKFSTSFISIIKYDDTGELFRQFVFANTRYCRVLEDNKTVSITVLNSTFDQPGAYYVQVEDNFVVDYILEEPMHGIVDHRWYFNTIQLTTENLQGTQIYKNSNHSERNDFYDFLLTALSIITPIDSSRLSPIYGFQFQTDAPSEQILLSVKILAGNASQITVKKAADNIDELIRNKDISTIGTMPPTSYLDDTYGFSISPNFWDKYKVQLIGVLLGFVVIVGIYLFARRAYPSGNNLAIFQFVIIIVDFVFDVLFIKFNGKDVPRLYLPSVIILTASSGINIFLASFIIARENHVNLDFHQWFARYGRICSFFTVLSTADIEALNILSSKFAGLDFLSAVYSEQAQKWLFWGSVAGLLIEDVPQLIVQVIYRLNVITWDIVPFVVIFSGAIIVFVKLLEKIFFAIQVCKKPRHQLAPTHYLNEEHIIAYPDYRMPAKEVDQSESDTVVMTETDSNTVI
ncbi:7339_t:CDS:10 [Ambispora leptoticha]|uniref:7339_t:CDS:1 n=1 Tax=Ambispora leptoticha TaxID=144679 RepID=A0A9N8ZG87_9GLOM|nr:7339_t:CDS:10 [Ambispora leptoticha]